MELASQRSVGGERVEREREREMGGGHGGDGHSTTYKGVTLHHPKRWHTLTGKGMCAIMCLQRFWVLYRAKQDGPVVLGWRHPWEGHGDHGHGHEVNPIEDLSGISIKPLC
ncbi:unnamed protein product [Camellia sinensis]